MSTADGTAVVLPFRLPPPEPDRAPDPDRWFRRALFGLAAIVVVFGTGGLVGAGAVAVHEPATERHNDRGMVTVCAWAGEPRPKGVPDCGETRRP